MSKEQSTRMFNAYDPASGIIKWTNGAGLVVATLDLNRVINPGKAGVNAVDEYRNMGAESVAAQAMIHGFTQKVGDAAALGIVNGKRPTWDEKAAAMRAVIDALYAGNWNAKREAGGMLYAAMQRLADAGSKKAAEYVAGWIGLDEEIKKSLAKSQTVMREIEKIRAERANPADDLIDDL